MLYVRVVVRGCLCCVVVRHCWVVFVGVRLFVCVLLVVVCPLLMSLLIVCLLFVVFWCWLLVVARLLLFVEVCW